MAEILVLYFSRHGATEALAREVCRGVDSIDGMSSRLRTVPDVSAVTEATEPNSLYLRGEVIPFIKEEKALPKVRRG